MGWRLLVLTLLAVTLGATGLLSLSLFVVGHITGDYSFAKSFPATSYILENQERYREARLQNTLKEENWRQEAEVYPQRLYPGWVDDIRAGVVLEIRLNTMTWKMGKKVYKQEFHLLLFYKTGQIFLADTSSFDANTMQNFIISDLKSISNDLRRANLSEITFIQGRTETVFLPTNSFLEGLRGIGLNNYMMIAMTFIAGFMAFVVYVLVRFQMTRGKLKLPPPLQRSETFNDIGGLEHAKEIIREIGLIAKYPQLFFEQGGAVIRGALFSGPPGTGKTLLMKAASNEIGIPVYAFKSTEFLDPIAPAVGAARVEHVYQQLKQNAPCIVFFDEVESVAQKRAITPSETRTELSLVLYGLLNQIGGIEREDEVAWKKGKLDKTVVTVMATNRPELVDEALLRSGRIGRHALCSPPNIETRKIIARIHSRNKPFSQDKKDEWLDWLADETSGFTGADLKDILNMAANFSGKRRSIKLEELKRARKEKRRRFRWLRWLRWTSGTKVIIPLENITLDDLNRALQETRDSLDKAEADPAVNIDKKVRAIHQSGHKIGERSRMGRKAVKPVSIVPGREWYQQTFWWKDLVTRETDLNDKKLRDIIAFDGCGRAAEMEVSGRVSLLSGDDFNKATEVAVYMASTGMLRDTFFGVLDKSEEERKLSDKDLAERSEKIKLLMKERFFDKATEIVRTYRLALDALTELLLAKEDCTAEEINKVLDRFGIPEPEKNNNNSNNNKSPA